MRRTEGAAALALLKLVRFCYDAQVQLRDHLVVRCNSDLFSYRVETKFGLD